MKRGDPFLPSIFPDENPIADYTAKKTSHKKPFDCKCKGFGYNASPSALLPEEMRQQWGVGMLCKPALSRSSIISTLSNSSTSDNQPKSTQSNLIINNGRGTSNNGCALRCKNYMTEPCSCTEVYTDDSFRIPDSNTRKQKLLTKGSFIKCKENKNSGSLLIGSTNRSSLLKRAAYCNSKDKNIISTSNFQRKSTSSLVLNGHSSAVKELNSCNCGVLSPQISNGRTYQSLRGNMMCNTRKHSMTTTQDERVITSQEQYHPHQSQQFLTNVHSSPVISCTSLNMPDGTFEAKAFLSGNASQMFMLGHEDCVCDSCQQRLTLMTRIEKLGFSTSNGHQVLSPFMLAASRRYQLSTFRPPTSTPVRYTPYKVPVYGYPYLSGDVYHSPERYQCPSPSFYEYSDPSIYTCPSLVSTQLPVTHEINNMDSSYLDGDHSMTLPQFAGFVEDITDLSVKDTVDFFVTMKSPFINSYPTSSVSERSAGVCSSLFSGEQCTSTGFNRGSNPCLYSIDMCQSTFSIPSIQQENIYGGPAHYKFEDTGGLTQPILYSSLASDLEDELRCAIENMPAG